MSAQGPLAAPIQAQLQAVDAQIGEKRRERDAALAKLRGEWNATTAEYQPKIGKLEEERLRLAQALAALNGDPIPLGDASRKSSQPPALLEGWLRN